MRPGSEAVDPPYRLSGLSPLAAVNEAHGGLGTGESSGVTVSVAGRVMRLRPQGKVAFGELRDWTGSLQLFATEKATEGFEAFCRLSLGDWISATGEVVRTRRGELSVLVSSFVVLAEARRGFGDKWHGVVDVDLRFRQREVDLWANEGVREDFLARTRVVSFLRRHLDAAGYVEVETPVLQPLAGGANARPFVTHFNALHADFYLRIAPELYLKRLVVGGFERVYEIGKSFRNEGLSPRHNPEFTMLEAYAAYADYLDMAALIEQLVSGAALELSGTTVIKAGEETIDLAPPWRRLTMVEAIAEVTGTEAELSMGRDSLAATAERLGVAVAEKDGPGKILLEIYEKTTEAHLSGPVHVLDYPEEVSPLTRRHREKVGYVERLTPVIAGREIAEVYSELVDPDDQRRRLSAQAGARAAGDEEAMPLDEEFLRALEHGMPPTGGVGLGVDRLVMLLTGKANIREVLLFPALRPGQSERDEAEDGPEEGDGVVG